MLIGKPCGVLKLATVYPEVYSIEVAINNVLIDLYVVYT